MALIGNKHSAQRLVNAENHLIDWLAQAGGISRDDAIIAARVYLKNKIAKLDMVMGRSTVKHGAFLDAHPIRKAVELGRANG